MSHDPHDFQSPNNMPYGPGTMTNAEFQSIMAEEMQARQDQGGHDNYPSYDDGNAFQASVPAEPYVERPDPVNQFVFYKERIAYIEQVLNKAKRSNKQEFTYPSRHGVLRVVPRRRFLSGLKRMLKDLRRQKQFWRSEVKRNSNFIQWLRIRHLYT